MDELYLQDELRRILHQVTLMSEDVHQHVTERRDGVEHLMTADAVELMTRVDEALQEIRNKLERVVRV